jgi:hypothetical protein
MARVKFVSIHFKGPIDPIFSTDTSETAQNLAAKIFVNFFYHNFHN